MNSDSAVSTATSSSVSNEPAEQVSADAVAPSESTHHNGERRYRRHRHKRGFSRVQRLLKRRAALIAGCILFVAVYAWLMYLLFGVFQKS